MNTYPLKVTITIVYKQLHHWLGCGPKEESWAELDPRGISISIYTNPSSKRSVWRAISSVGRASQERNYLGFGANPYGPMIGGNM